MSSSLVHRLRVLLLVSLILLHLLDDSRSMVDATSPEDVDDSVDTVVPLIDLGPWLSSSSSSSTKTTTNLSQDQRSVVDAIHQACQQVGFFMIINHGFDTSVMEEAWKASQQFFALSTDEKLLHKTTNETEYPYGYEQSETLAKGKQLDHGKDERIMNDNQTTTDDDDAFLPTKDLKETFAIGPHNTDSGMPPRRWIATPNLPPNFQRAVENYYQHMEQLALTLLEIFAWALGEEADFFETKMSHHQSALRLAHYYPLDASQQQSHTKNKKIIRAGGHTDYGALTILAAHDEGLEVFVDQKWIPVPLLPNTFIINLGDLMQRWTHDQWISTLHRVAMPAADATKAQRYSMAYFVNVNGDTLIEPLRSCLLLSGDATTTTTKYPTITAGEHLMAKHLASMGDTTNMDSGNARDEL